MSDQPRIAAGTPSGGEFSAHERPESAVELDNIPLTINPLSMRAISNTGLFFLDNRKRINLNPPYQRGSVWDQTRRQNLAKSLLSGIPVGAIVVNHLGYDVGDTYLNVIDGKQRIEALRGLADGEFGIPASWVEPRFRGAIAPIDYDGQTVPGVLLDSEDHPFRRVLDNLVIPTAEARVKTVEEEAAIYLLINSGGVEQQETDLARAANVQATRARLRSELADTYAQGDTYRLERFMELFERWADPSTRQQASDELFGGYGQRNFNRTEAIEKLFRTAAAAERS